MASFIDDAVAASILSTRWGILFPFFWIPPTPIVIDLDYSRRRYSYTSRTHENFKKFIDKLLNDTLIDVSCLQWLNLNCGENYYDVKYIKTLVEWALLHNVLQLSLGVHLRESKPLFQILNGCATLTCLELGTPLTTYGRMNEMLVEFLDGFTLPNLKKLVLSRLTSHYKNSLNELINCFPALECLNLRRCSFGECLCIESPILKNLTIETGQYISLCVLKIYAPKLKVMQYIGETAKSIDIVSNFKSLVSAHIDMDFPSNADGVEDFVTRCSSITRLYLSTNSFQALRRSIAKLPMFRNLSRLALGHIQLNAWTMLADLLCNSPNLEKLTFEQGLCLQAGGFSRFISYLFSSPPICLKHHVKEIEFWTFNETEDEIKLIEYFLNNGEFIRTIKLRCLPFTYKTKHHNTLSKLYMLPSQSKLVFQPKPKIESQYDP